MRQKNIQGTAIDCPFNKTSPNEMCRNFIATFLLHDLFHFCFCNNISYFYVFLMLSLNQFKTACSRLPSCQIARHPSDHETLVNAHGKRGGTFQATLTHRHVM